jgi:mannose-6-phosphate isomerase-like protein (cupin superfamily)
MVLEGALEIEIDGEATRPPVGEEVLIPAGARHTVRNVGGTPARWLHGHRRG